MDVIQVVDEGTFWNPITYAVFLPLLGALVLLLVPRTQEQLQKGVALATTLATAAIGVFILTDFDYDRAGDLQYYANLGWIEVINSRYIVGLDGISLPLFALTAQPTASRSNPRACRPRKGRASRKSTP